MSPNTIHTRSWRAFAAIQAVALTFGFTAAPQGSSVAAAFTTPATASDQSVDRLFAYYQSLKSFQADFRQTKQLKREGLTLESDGTLRVSLGQALLWEVTTPGYLGVYLDATQLKIRSGSGPQATQATYDLQHGGYSEKIAENLRELTAILSMNRAALAQSYQVSAAEDGLTLVPKAPRQFARVQMKLAEDRWIARLEIDELSGDRMVLTFTPPRPSDTGWTTTWTKGG